jgi:hypothetical protein
VSPYTSVYYLNIIYLLLPIIDPGHMTCSSTLTVNICRNQRQHSIQTDRAHTRIHRNTSPHKHVPITTGPCPHIQTYYSDTNMICLVSKQVLLLLTAGKCQMLSLWAHLCAIRKANSRGLGSSILSTKITWKSRKNPGIIGELDKHPRAHLGDQCHILFP